MWPIETFLQHFSAKPCEGCISSSIRVNVRPGHYDLAYDPNKLSGGSVIILNPPQARMGHKPVLGADKGPAQL